MENTLENKAAFINQYYGCKVLYVGGVGLQEVGKGGWNLKHSSFFIELTPLSNISDDDAIEVAKIANWGPLHSDRVKAGKSIVNGKFGIDSNAVNPDDEDYDTILNYIPVFDFLRSKGYALPFRGVDVETLISWGWVKLKTEKE